MKSKNYEVVIWGEPSFDTVVIPLEEEKLDSRNSAEIVEDIGGSGANTASNISLLGISTLLLGSIGSDSTGIKISEELNKRNIDSLLSKVNTNRRTVSIARPDGTRTMYGTTSDQYTSVLDLDHEIQEIAAQMFHVSLTSILRSNHFHILKTVKYFQSQGAIISLDAGNDLEIEKSERVLDTLFQEIQPDILFANHDEVIALRSSNVDLNQFPVIVVKRGIKGCDLLQRGSITKEIPVPVEIRAIDTTGAGDAFASGMLAGLLSGLDLSSSATLGHLVAGACIQTVGASIRDPELLVSARNFLLAFKEVQRVPLFETLHSKTELQQQKYQ